MTNRRESAQVLALQALAWLASEEDRLQPFLAAGGLDAGSLRALAGDPMLQGAVLDFLLGDEQLLLAFCAETGVPPEQPIQARAALPGGDAPFWT